MKKLESLKLEKFNSNSLEKEQMFSLKGGTAAYGTVTDGGNITGPHAGGMANFDYGYDSYRDGTLTFHNRSNVTFQ